MHYSRFRVVQRAGKWSVESERGEVVDTFVYAPDTPEDEYKKALALSDRLNHDEVEASRKAGH